MLIIEREYVEAPAEDDGARELVLTIEASAGEVDAAVRAYFDELNQNEVAGFRRGKAPRQALEQGVGGHAKAYGQVAQRIIDDGAFRAIDNADILFLEDPEFEVWGVPEDGKPFSFRATGRVAPVVGLSSFEPVTIEMPPDEATPAEIAAELQDMRACYYTSEAIDDADHRAQMGDSVSMTLTCTQNGETVFGLHQVPRLIELGQGSMPPSFESHILGAKAGDVLEFDFDGSALRAAGAAPGGHDGGDARDQMHAQVQITGFSRNVLPQLDDEFARKMGALDLADLRRSVQRGINERKNTELPQLMQQRVVEALSARVEEDIPPYFVDFMRQNVTQELMRQLEQQGVSLQQWLLDTSADPDQFRANLESEALKRARADLALEALFAHGQSQWGWQVSRDDIDRQLQESGDPHELYARLAQAGRLADVRKMCRQDTAMRWLVKTARVVVVDAAHQASGAQPVQDAPSEGGE